MGTTGAISDARATSRLVTARRPVAAATKVLLDWALILAVFVVVAHHPSWPYMLAGFVLIGIQQSALGQWMHEGAHWLIAKNRTANDLFVVGLLSGPLFVPFDAFRRRHFTHHRHLGTPQDTKPVIFARVDGRRFCYFFLRNCLGVQLFSIAKGYFVSGSSAQKSAQIPLRRWILDAVGVVAPQCILLLLLSHIAPWTFYLWLWVLPWLTINRFITGLRGVIEHHPLPFERHPLTRTLRPTLLDRFLLCRAGAEYHWTHHLYPDIPCFNLPLVDIQVEQPTESRRGYLETLFLLVRSSPEVTEISTQIPST